MQSGVSLRDPQTEASHDSSRESSPRRSGAIWHATALKQRRRYKEGLQPTCSAPWWDEDGAWHTVKHRGSEGQHWGGLDSEGPSRHELAQQLWKPRPGQLQVRPSHGALTNFQGQQRSGPLLVPWDRPCKANPRRTRLVQKLQEWHLLAKGLSVKAIAGLEGTPEAAVGITEKGLEDRQRSTQQPSCFCPVDSGR